MRRRVQRVFAIVCCSAVGVSCASAIRASAPVVTREGVRFAVDDPVARSISVAGTFNQWSPTAHPLVRTPSSGVWTTVVALPPGEHQFVYVVDGAQWIAPPQADDYVDDGFGSRNGVVVVRPTEH